MATADLPWAKRVDTIRALLDSLRQPHGNWLERWAIFGRWVMRSPEYVAWLLRAYDAQQVRLKELGDELAKVRSILLAVEPPPARRPPPPIPPDDTELAFEDAFTDDLSDFEDKEHP